MPSQKEFRLHPSSLPTTHFRTSTAAAASTLDTLAQNETDKTEVVKEEEEVEAT